MPTMHHINQHTLKAQTTPETQPEAQETIAMQGAVKPQETVKPQEAAARMLRIGVDIGGTKILAIATDMRGEQLLASAEEPTQQGNDAIIATVSEVVDRVLAALDVPQASIAARVHSIGMGTPGIVNPRTGAVEEAVNLGVERLELASLIAARYDGVPVRVDNDVNAAAWGAFARYGEQARASASPFVFLNLGTGLASGIIVGGKLVHGFSGAAGEIGHIPVDVEQAPCGCGQHGCLETVASGSGLARIWPVAAGKYPLAELLRQAHEGDARAIETLQHFTNALDDAIIAASVVLDPATIVIGGGVSGIGEPLRELAVHSMEQRERASGFLGRLQLSKRLRFAEHHVPFGALGAALLVE